MFLALHEIRRGLVRFGLLAMAIGLLLFLVLFQQALQDGLLTSFVGALRNQSAPVLVYAVDGQRTLQGSVLTPDLESAILAVDGVGKHGRIGQGTFTTVVNDAEATDTAVIGTDPTRNSHGRPPSSSSTPQVAAVRLADLTAAHCSSSEVIMNRRHRAVKRVESPHPCDR